MEIKVTPGKYIVAVSGGVDSMVLLHLLSKSPKLGLIVAHYNHGIRADSEKDEMLVAKTARELKLPIEIGHGNLGAKASEALARQARYKFLNQLKEKYAADALMTAHHQDDLIETALINVLRGSGPKGLVAIKLNPEVLRPLLDYPKVQIVAWAKDNQLVWREDSSNQDSRYLRNYLRQNILDRLRPQQRNRLVKRLDGLAKNSQELDALLDSVSAAIKPGDDINRQKFIELPLEVASQLVVFWLRQARYNQFDKKNIDKFVVALKTAKPNTRHNVLGDLVLVLTKTTARLERSA